MSRFDVFRLRTGEGMSTQFAAAISVSELGERVARLDDHDIAIGNALDMLINGF